jgi:RNA polymerase sigma-70 factor, ECF subfamily
VLALVAEHREDEGFEGLVDRYERKVYNLVFRLIGDPDDAADVTQETFVAAFRAYGSFRGESSAYTWLCSIAVNKCKNRFRERDRRTGVEGLSLDVAKLHETEAAAAPSHADPEKSLERAELRSRVEEAISRLPDDYRIMTVLRDLNGLSYQEIADVTELTVDVVKTRLARARAMLRRSLEPYLVTE